MTQKVFTNESLEAFVSNVKAYTDNEVNSLPQSDWNQNDETAKDYIKNKPTIPNDEEMLELLMETEIASPVRDEAGAVYIDNNEKIYIL